MRAVIYARYSSDLQSAASAEDQIAICEERIAREGWTLAGVFLDEGISGASVLRPMNALFLTDLADKTRRGLRGPIERGRAGGRPLLWLQCPA